MRAATVRHPLYSPAQKAAAVALARAIGGPEAARQLGIDRRTIQSWQVAAPAEEPDGDLLQPLYELSLAKVTQEVATGKIRGVGLAAVMGIARDKLDRAARWRARTARNGADAPKPDPDDQESGAEAAFARWAAFVDALDPDVREDGRTYFSTMLRDELDRRSDTDYAADSADPNARNMAVELDEIGDVDESPEIWDRIVTGLIEAFTRDIPNIRARRARIEARREEGVRLPPMYEQLLDEAEQTLANLEESA